MNILRETPDMDRCIIFHNEEGAFRISHDGHVEYATDYLTFKRDVCLTFVQRYADV